MDIAKDTVEPQARFINRELSWLAFDRRVLAQARDETYPLLERVRFLSIAANNLDEFHMVSLANFRHRIQPGYASHRRDIADPAEALETVEQAAEALSAAIQSEWEVLRSALAQAGIAIVTPHELTPDERSWAEEFYNQQVAPLLTPVVIEPGQPFPFIPNRGIAILMQLQADQPIYGTVRLPAQLQRFVRVGGSQPRLLPLEALIELHIGILFPSFGIIGSAPFRVLRDSELDIDDLEDDPETHLSHFEVALERRRNGQVVRVSATSGRPEALFAYLADALGSAGAVCMAEPLPGLADTRELAGLARPDLLFPAITPAIPAMLAGQADSLFALLRRRDLLLHHPYESFDIVVNFIARAASDPAVVAIRQTLYRTSADSPIVKSLIEAALAGKSVTVVMELRARFEEEANLKWARDLEGAGAEVIYGFPGLKVHAKLSLVTRREGGELVSYVHYGTGNYHPQTARVYTDLSLLTADTALSSDAGKLFNYITGHAEPVNLQKIATSPLTLRRRLVQLIAAEAENARGGRPSGIRFKLNALVDPDIIEALYAASQAGVPVRGVVRGMCSLRPGVPGLSETIEITSIVGRFLEHARIALFANGAELPGEDNLLFLSSADWMPRNLDHRIETLVPVDDMALRNRLMGILDGNLRDTRRSWRLDADGNWTPLAADQVDGFSAQDSFMLEASA